VNLSVHSPVVPVASIKICAWCVSARNRDNDIAHSCYCSSSDTAAAVSAAARKSAAALPQQTAEAVAAATITQLLTPLILILHS
jgi:hypothetical protein